jgi:hypothetical protein
LGREPNGHVNRENIGEITEGRRKEGGDGSNGTRWGWWMKKTQDRGCEEKKNRYKQKRKRRDTSEILGREPNGHINRENIGEIIEGRRKE